MEKELQELKQRHLEAMSFFKDISDREDNSAIAEKFEPINVRDEFEYTFKAFSKSLDAILPKKEAQSYVDDFKYLSRKRYAIRNWYGGVGESLREYGKKVQQLIDDHVRSLNVSELVDRREITYDNFLSYAAKFKSERARTALIKNKARQIIRELAPNNPAYYEKLRERLEKIIQEEETRRKENADYFNASKYEEIYKEVLNEDKERKNLGFSTKFEFAVYGEIQPLKNDKELSKSITRLVFEKIKEETGIIGWKAKTSSEKKMMIAIYDILAENNFPTEKIGGLALRPNV